MLSRRCAYGIRAMSYLASREQPDVYTPIHEVAAALSLSPYFLAKVLQELVRQGFLKSARGPNGGVALARSPQSIRLKELIVALDGPALFTTCVLGLPGCGECRPCPLHEEWEGARARIERLFETITVAEAARHDELLEEHG